MSQAKPLKPHAPEVLETLRKYDTPTISNVIELFDVRPVLAGFMNASIRALYPHLPPSVGYATTATCRSAYPPASTDTYRRLADHAERMQEVPAPRVAVVQDLNEPPVAAVVGEVMSRMYQRFGCAGFITNGAARDLLQIEKLRFPIFASAVIVTHGYHRLEDIHVPVRFGGVTVHPGDLLHADASGVVIIPSRIAQLVADTCEEFCACERMVLDYLDTAPATPKGFRKIQQASILRVGALSAKVRKKLARLGVR
jgi:regulator of RNase E activity RraA